MKRLLIFFLFCITGQLLAQAPLDTVMFPIVLHPGDSFEVQKEYLIKDANKDSVYKLTVTNLHLLRDRQLRNLLKMAKKQKADSAMASILEKQVNILKLIQTEKDSIITLNHEGYIHYRDLWEETDRKLEEEEIKNAKKFRWGVYVGAGVSIATITAFKLIADNNQK
jgi:hypothetical protein